MEISFDGNKKISTYVDGFHIQTDLPATEQGDYSAPTPYQLFLASIACCVGISIKYYCDTKKISAEGMEISVNTHWDKEKARIEKIDINIILPNTFPPKYEPAIVNVVNSCKVKKQLHPDIKSIININRR